MMLCAESASFRYAEGEVLHDVSLQVPTGGLTGILGPNGSGKTTLLRLLAGLDDPSRGQVQLGGQNLAQLRRQTLARRMAMVPQETHMAFDYSVLEVVLMGRYPHLGAFAIEGPADLACATEALESTGTEELSTRPFTTLSGGEKQRVVIASALAQVSGAAPDDDAKILLLDEPTASLDLAYQLETARLVRALNAQGITIVISTHDLNFAASICRDLVLLRDGHIIDAGATEDVLTEANVEALYGVSAQVMHSDVAGHMLVVPVER